MATLDMMVCRISASFFRDFFIKISFAFHFNVGYPTQAYAKKKFSDSGSGVNGESYHFVEFFIISFAFYFNFGYPTQGCVIIAISLMVNPIVNHRMIATLD